MHLARPAAVLLTLAAAAPASAQVWIQRTPGDWLDPANWSTGTVPNGPGAAASIIADTAGGALENPGAFTATSAVRLRALTLDLIGSPLSIDVALETIDFDNGASPALLFARGGGLVEVSAPIRLTSDLRINWQSSPGIISSNIEGPGGITLDAPNPSRLRLWGDNAYDGPTNVTSGILSIQTIASLGSPNAGTTVEPAGTLRLDNTGAEIFDDEPLTLDGGLLSMQDAAEWRETIQLGSAGRIGPAFDGQVAEVSGQVSGGRLIRESASPSTVQSVESVLLLTNVQNDYSGGTIIRAGILAVDSNDALGDPAAPITFESPANPAASEGLPALLTTSTIFIPRDINLESPASLRALAGAVGIYTGEIASAGPLGADAMNINAPPGAGFVGNPDLDDWTGTVSLRTGNTYEGDTIVHAGALQVENTLGSATGTGTLILAPDAALTGAGLISGPVDMTQGGVLRPGSPVGEIQTGGITMGPDSSTVILISGSAPGEFDRIVNSTTTTVDGELVILNTADPPLTPGDEFEIIFTPQRLGTFATITGGDDFDIEYNFDGVVLVYKGAPCPADLTGDNAVSADDLAALLAAWGQTGVPADLAGDGVGADDLAALLAAWGPCN